MKYQKQIYRHDPENGVYGDCFRTAIACLLDIDATAVPHFFDQGADPDEAYRAMEDWLSGRGLSFIEIPFTAPSVASALQTCAGWVPASAHYILHGKSRTGCGHVVVCKGEEVVWDPSLTDAGIIGPNPELGAYRVSALTIR